MVDSQQGADPEQLDRLARVFGDAGRRVETVLRDAMRLSAEAAWRGADAEEFQAELRGPLGMAAQRSVARLSAAGDGLGRQAQQQRQASAAGDVTPAHLPPGGDAGPKPDLAPPGTEADRERRHGSARPAGGSVWEFVKRLPAIGTVVGVFTLLYHLQQWIDRGRSYGVDDPRTREALRQVGLDCIDTGAGIWKEKHVSVVLAVIAFFYGPELTDLLEPSTWINAAYDFD